MSKAPRRRSKSSSEDDLRPEYEFDYSTSKPNRFASQFGRDSVALVLDPDVAAIFNDPEVVNALLRSLLPAVREAGTKVEREGGPNRPLQRTGSARR